MAQKNRNTLIAGLFITIALLFFANCIQGIYCFNLTNSRDLYENAYKRYKTQSEVYQHELKPMFYNSKPNDRKKKS